MYIYHKSNFSLKDKLNYISIELFIFTKKYWLIPCYKAIYTRICF